MDKTSKKLIAGLAVFSLVLSSTVTSVMAESPVSASAQKKRLGGANRYETAVKVSQAGWKASDYVIIANGQEFADALSAAPLAKKLDAPILLTEGNTLISTTKDEIKRLNAKHVVIIGLNGAVSSTAEAEIKALGVDTKRIGGADRYETSTLVAKELDSSSKVVIASGENYPDALSIAPIAALEEMPILLTRHNELPKSVSDYISLNKSKITKTYVVGQEGAVSAAVAKAADANAVRLGGANRYETNADILESFADELNFKNIYAAVGEGAQGNEFADALAGAALAVKTSSPVVLVYKNLNSKTQEAIQNQMAPKKNVVALGGDVVLPDSVVDSINNLQIDAAIFAVDGETKSAGNVSKNNVSLDAKNVTLKDANVSGNVYIYGDGAKLSNVKVAGTVFIDPGENGSVTLENVQASKIRVRSGAENSIHLINVTADHLVVESDNNDNSVRVVSSGTTNIGDTVVTSYAIVDSEGGNLGTVTITTNSAGQKTVQLEGTFTAPVVVSGGATVDVAAGANVSSIKVVGSASIKAEATANVKTVEIATLGNETVNLAGKISNVQLESGAKVNVAAGSNISSINVSNTAQGAVLDVPTGATIGSVTGAGASGVQVTGSGAGSVTVGQPAAGGGGGGGGGYSGGGTTTPTTQYYYMDFTYVKDDGSTITYDLKLGDKSIVQNSTLAEVYDANVKAMQPSDTMYLIIDTLIDKEIEKGETKFVGTVNLNKYYGSRLSAKDPGSIIGGYLTSNDPNANSQMTNYIKGKSYSEMHSLLLTKTNGDITVPEVTYGTTGPKLTSIDVLDKSYAPGSVVNISEIETALNLSGTSKLVDIASMTSSKPILVVNLSDGTKYQITVANGQYTMSTPSGKTFVIGFSLK